MTTTINRGNSYILEISVVDENNNPVDLTSVRKVVYTMAKSVKDTTPYIFKNLDSSTVQIVDKVGGIIEVLLTSDDTDPLVAGHAYHELVVEDTLYNVTTLLCEYLIVSDKILIDP